MEQQALRLADQLYTHYYGHVEDINFRDEKVLAIYSWLLEGKFVGADAEESLPIAIQEWGKVDRADIEANAVWP